MRQINKWKILTEDIVDIFIREYFEISDDEDIEYFWVSDEVGGIFEFSDYWFNFSDVLNCYKHKITKEQLFEWYDHNLSEPYVKISLAKFILSPEKRLKEEEESLEISRKNLTFVKEEFNKAIEKYGN